MNKLVSVVILLCFVTAGFSQTVKKAQSYLEGKQLDKAKTEIDGVLAKTPNDAEGNYLKVKIYEAIASDPVLSKTFPGDLRQEAFEAYKKVVADSANIKSKMMVMRENYQPVFNLYSGYYEAAAKAFNDAASSQSKEGFKDAMNLFEKANNIGQYIRQNEWANIGKVDSTLVLNIGKAALNAGDDAASEKYFKELADAKIDGTGGKVDESFSVPYQWLTLFYKEKKDEANMKKYGELGRSLYPKENYFNLVMMDYYREAKDMKGLFNIYDELLKENPDSTNYHFSYANDIFGYIYNSDEGTVIKDKDAMLQKLQAELDHSMRLNPNDVNNNWLYAQFFYNKGIETRDQADKIRSTKPEDVKKKTDLNTQSKDFFNKAIPYADKAITTLEVAKLKGEKSKYKSIVNLMQNIYQSLQLKDKLKIYQDKYDNADKVFTN
ncbi:MAG: hypothetical protein JSS98_00645 [Bacteroidetes bacterium]|nr:hypothetical protein [Bacteroidota bacterium]